MYRIVLPAIIFAMIPAAAQTFERRASMVGGGDSNRGKCTIEVVVDGAAEVSITGDRGVLRTLSGRAAQWRRFECNAPLPNRPAEFRFAGVDGRGRQELVRDPRNGGAAVVRIEDKDGGAEGYTFDLFWGGGYGGGDQRGGGDWRGGAGPGPVIQEPGRRNGRFTTEQAIDVCREEVRRNAMERFGARDIEFTNLRIDDNPGRRDWVIGNFSVRRARGSHSFACAVNFDTGRVRSVDIDRGESSDRWDRDHGTDRAVSTCQREVENRIRSRGFDDVRFGAIKIDDRPGRNDWVVGNAQADRDRGRRSERFDFSCRVDLASGNVRSVDLGRR